MRIDQALLEARGKIVVQELLGPAGPADQGGDRLRMPGLETVLFFVAQKVLIPIFCSFAGRELYDRHKSVQTKEDAKRAGQDLAAAKLADKPAVPLAEVEADLVSVLEKEGIPPDRARQIVSAHWSWLEQQVSSKTPGA